MSWWEDFLIAAATIKDEEDRVNKNKSKQSKKNTDKSKTAPKVVQTKSKKVPLKQSTSNKTKSKSSRDLFGLSGIYDAAVSIDNLKSLNKQVESSSDGTHYKNTRVSTNQSESISSDLPQYIPFGVTDENEIIAKRELEKMGYSTSNWFEYIDNLQELFSNDNSDDEEDDDRNDDDDEDLIYNDHGEEESENMDKQKKIIDLLIKNTEVMKEQFDTYGFVLLLLDMILMIITG